MGSYLSDHNLLFLFMYLLLGFLYWLSSQLTLYGLLYSLQILHIIPVMHPEVWHSVEFGANRF